MFWEEATCSSRAIVVTTPPEPKPLVPEFPDRSMSAFQESAQYLAGSEAPEQILSSLLSKVNIPDTAVIGLINLSPYDSWLEWTAHYWPKSHPGTCMPTLSLSKSVPIIEYCQRSIALKLLEDI